MTRTSRSDRSLAIVGAAACLSTVVTVATPAAAPAATPLATCHGRTVTITGTAGPDTITGTAGADVIAAGGGDDTVRGLGGDDVVCGEDGDDSLFGGPGDDLLDAGEAPFGANTLAGEAGDDVLVSTDNIATLDYRFAPAAVRVDLPQGVATGRGHDTLTGRFDVIGSQFDDTIIGKDGTRLVGLAGADTIIGSSRGEDIYPDTPASIKLPSDHAADTVRSGDETLPHDYDRVFPDGGADRISTGAGNDKVRGHVDGGRIDLGGGSDSGGVTGKVTVFGGPGAEFFDSGPQGSIYGGGGGDRIGGRLIVGGPGDDYPNVDVGSTQPDVVVRGGDGYDEIIAFAPRDEQPAEPLTIELSPGVARYRANGAPQRSVTYEAIERIRWYLDSQAVELTGSDTADIPTLAIGSRTLSASMRGGRDRLSLGSTSFRVSGGGDDDVINAIKGKGTLLGDGGDDRLTGSRDVNILIGGSGDDELSGDDGADQLYGGAGDDALLGGSGDDRLYGQVGADSADGGDGVDVCKAEARVRCEA